MNINIKIFFTFLFFISLCVSLYPTNFSQELINLQITNYSDFILLPFQKFSQEKVFIFGGLIDGTPTNNLYEVLLQTQQYQLIQQNNNFPQARYKHCGVVVNSKLYIYGGLSQNITILNDLWVYDSIDQSWTFLGNTEEQIEFCSLLYNNEYIYIFGNNSTSLTSKTIKFSIDSLQWQNTNINFIQRVKMRGKGWNQQNITTQIDIRYTNEINQSQIIQKVLEQQIQFSFVCTTTNNQYNYFITQKNIYQINFQNNQIQIIKKIYKQINKFKCLTSSQWLFIFYLVQGSINIIYYYLHNIQTYNQIFKIGNLQNINQFQIFIDLQENIHFIIADNLTSWILIKNCSNITLNIFYCFYSQIICNQGYYGQNCNIPICYNSLILYDQINYGSLIFQCSNHGTCTINGCQCDQNWSGQDCSNYLRTQCHGQIIQNWPVANCQCTDETSGGNYCQVTFCYNDCSGRGTCQSSGQCICDSDYAGTDCSITIIQFL